jgi:5-(carboxyamino)imidazole ribonucleotide synthase
VAPVPGTARHAAKGTSPQRPFAVGIVGAGQLARMTCLAAWPLGIRVAVLGRPGEPAAGTAAGLVEGDWRSAADVARLAAEVGVVTLENEFVDAAALAAVEAAGTPVRPGPATLAAIQDKAVQKQRMHDAGLPTARWLVAEHSRDLRPAGRDLGWPLMLKARRLGYDGYGNATVGDAAEAAEAFARLAGDDGLLVEEIVPFDRELAVMVARNPSGERRAYPVVETVQRHHVCHEVSVPAQVSQRASAQATEIALEAVEAVDGLGVTGIELFVLAGGAVLVNELAPRPHNSGHYSIEACETSQFENHLRGVLDLPLGATDLRRPAAAMVNLLGSRSGPARPALREALAVPGAHLHLYEKAEVRVRRKMGHVTALADAPEQALATARRAAEEVGL